MLKQNDHLLFMGDSITHAHRRPEELHDCYSLGGGYAKIVAGTLNADRPDLAMRFSNRGECGHGTADLDLRWQTDCLDLRPDVLSILIGVNDAHPARADRSVDAFAKRYRKLLDRTRQSLPAVRLILMEPFALWVSPEQAPVQTILAEQLAAVEAYGPAVEQIANEYAAVFVPTQAAFRAAAERASAGHWMLDGIHPSAAGHVLIARQWLGAVVGSARHG